MKFQAKRGKNLYLQQLGFYKNMPRNHTGTKFGSPKPDHFPWLSLTPDKKYWNSLTFQKENIFPDFPWWWQPWIMILLARWGPATAHGVGLQTEMYAIYMERYASCRTIARCFGLGLFSDLPATLAPCQYSQIVLQAAPCRPTTSGKMPTGMRLAWREIG